MQLLERKLRHMKYGERITIQDGLMVGTHQVRREITKMFDKYSKLEHELQMSKAHRATSAEVLMEHLVQKIAEREQQNKEQLARMTKLEGDYKGAKHELENLSREKRELLERSEKMANENLPVIEKIDAQLKDLHATVSQLTADAEMLSQMFRLQVHDRARAAEARDEEHKKLTKARRDVKQEQMKGQFKVDELSKKETLCRRTLEARTATHETYLASKALVEEAAERLRAREADHQEMLRHVAGKEERVAQLREELRQQHRTMDDLEQQKKACTEEFRTQTGQSYNMLLEHSKSAR